MWHAFLDWASRSPSSATSPPKCSVISDAESQIHRENGEFVRTQQIVRYIRQIAQEEREWGEFGEGERAAELLEEVANDIERFKDVEFSKSMGEG